MLTGCHETRQVRVSPPHEPIYVGCTLQFTMPSDYPESSPVQISIKRQEGLGDRLVRGRPVR